MPDVRGVTAASFLKDYFKRYGPLKVLISDDGTQFKNNAVKDVIEEHFVEHRTAPRDHSRGNFLAERAIQMYKDRLSLETLEDQDETSWDARMPDVTYSINTSYHRSTGFTPYYLQFGRDPPINNIQVSNFIGKPQELYAELLQSRTDTALVKARHNQEANQKNSEKYFLAKHRSVKYDLGDKVWVRQSKRDGTKISNKFTGPYVVEENFDDIHRVSQKMVTGFQVV